jgi:hypothetical protein
MKASLKAAIACGAAPLLTGVAIFIAWVATRADWLMAAGVIVLFAGVSAVACGVVCLAWYVWGAWRSQSVPDGRLACQTIAVLGLFLTNFLAARAAVWGGLAIHTRYTVSITNRSAVPLESARVEDGGVSISLGTIQPGATVKRGFWVEQEGELFLRGTQGGETVEAVIDGYVAPNLGGDATVGLEADGTVSVEHRR